MTNEALINEIYVRFMNAIDRIQDSAVSDIYALSIYFELENDDYRLPKAVLGYNTISNIHAKALDVQKEAKWNFAFWLQNEESVAGGDTDEFVNQWVRELPDYYSDEQAEADIDLALEKGERIKVAFASILIEVAVRLHSNSIIERKFRAEIPIIIHELEYSEVPIQWTKAANPQGLAAEFEAWVESLRADF